MIRPETIPLIADTSTTDYEQLRTRGIMLLQQLSGTIWTDYNEHDPGVTILEELCYVLTELGYMATQPVEDLLTLRDGSFPAASNCFYTAATILHNNPVTINDYRKLIADRIPDVSNVWVYPFYLETGDGLQFGVSGMYRVVVDLNEGIAPWKENAGTNEEDPDPMGYLKTLLYRYRNIGELFPSITCLRQEPLHLRCTIYVEDATTIDQVLATILIEVEDYLKPGIPFYSLDEMQSQGYTVEQIFEGPKLRSGFVKDEDLVEQVTEVYADSLLKLLLKDGIGVSNVTDLKVIDTNNWVYVYYPVMEGTSVYLDKMATLENITVSCRGINVQVRKRTVILLYNELRTQRNVKKALRRTKQVVDLPIPQGNYLQPANYYSIQNDFPVIYGIGQHRLPLDASEDRKARALQLKAFLLFFEQLMADYRSQLESLHQLFSFHPQEKTYFYQTLYKVPDVAPLLKGYAGKTEEIYTHRLENNYVQDTKAYMASPNPYTKGLSDIYEHNDDFSERRPMFLKHLLSRFNFEPFLFSDSENAQNDAITLPNSLDLLEELLRKMPSITANRGRASVAYPSANGFIVTSGLEQLVNTLTGIFNEHHPAYENSEELSLQVISAAPTDALFEEKRSRRTYIEINTEHPDFYKALYAGLLSSNFVRDESGEGALCLMVAGNDDSSQRYVLRHWPLSRTFIETMEEIDLLVQEFSVIYRYYERFYMIDHVSLMPALTDKVFSWKLPPDTSIGKVEEGSQLNCEDLLFSVLGELSDHTSIVPDVYVQQSDGTQLPADFYSFQASVIVPKTAMDLRGDLDNSAAPFGNYFRFIVCNNAPLHLVIRVYELEDEAYRAFIAIRRSGSTDAMARFLNNLARMNS